MTKRRHIVIFAASYPHAGNPAAGIFVQQQAECLAVNHQVTVLVPHAPNASFFGKWLFFRSNTSLEGKITVIRLSKAAIPSMLFAFLRAPLASLRHTMIRYNRMCQLSYTLMLSRYINEHGKPDIIHAHNILPSGWAACIVAQTYNIPVLITEHSSLFAQHMRQRNLRAMVHWACNRARISAVSPALMQIMHIDLPELPVALLPNIIRTERFIQGPTRPSNHTRFLCLCLLTENKGVQYLLESTHALLKSGYTKFKLTIAGDGPYRAALETMSAPFREYVEFCGMVTQGQAVEHMQNCDLFILPSLGETFGIVLGEAMACGKPVLATRCGGAEFVVTPETGKLVSKANAMALAEAMASFLRGEWHFDAAAIRKSVSDRFSEQAFMHSCQQLYTEILG